MATFERESCESSTTGHQSPHQKYTIRRLEPAIKKFLKVIQIDLARLHRHRLNVEKYNRLTDWPSLHSEQINATRTVQQIKANLHEIEKCRLQIRDEDLETFDKRVDDMKHGAIKSVREFVEVTLTRESSSCDSTPSNSSPSDDLDPLVTLTDPGHVHGSLLQGQLPYNDLPENTDVAESWDNLQENLEELNTMIHQFATLVDEQQEAVDRIEDNIEHAGMSVRDGAKQLGKAAKYKSAILPIAGAVIGTALGGPIGFVAGAKIGALGAVGGSAVGYISGRFFKKRSDKVTNIELSNLTRSNSVPEIPATVEDQSRSWFSWSRKRNQSTTEIQNGSLQH